MCVASKLKIGHLEIEVFSNLQYFVFYLNRKYG